MDADEFRNTIRNRILEEFLAGSRRFLLWGFNAVCVKLIPELQHFGLLEHISGIIDKDAANQALTSFPLPIFAPSRLPELPMDTLVVLEDEGKEQVLKEFMTLDRRMPKIILAGAGHFAFDDRTFIDLLKSNPVSSKAGGYPNMRTHIYQCLTHLVRSGKRGAIIEFGAYRCGTTIFIARLLKQLDRSERIIAFDTFGAYPPKRHTLDIFSSRKCECPDFNEVKAQCDKFGIELIKGDIYETVEAIRGLPLMFTFFDTDNYSPTKAALELCYEQTIDGGVLAFDHFFSEKWIETIGERMAVKEVLSSKPLLNLHGTGIFLKV